MLVRVQKLLSEAGIASRRKSEDLIIDGRVKVNGKVIHIGDKALETDNITVDDKPIKKEKRVYILLNKKPGYVCSNVGPRSILKDINCEEKIFSVGRLDMDAEGLLILTNDGDFANKIIHPSHKVLKTYTVELDNPLDKQGEKRLLTGFNLFGRFTRVENPIIDRNFVTISIMEGRKHIVKLLFEKLHRKVLRLKRVGIGNLKLSNLEGYRYVSKEFLEKSIWG